MGRVGSGEGMLSGTYIRRNVVRKWEEKFIALSSGDCVELSHFSQNAVVVGEVGHYDSINGLLLLKRVFYSKISLSSSESIELHPFIGFKMSSQWRVRVLRGGWSKELELSYAI